MASVNNQTRVLRETAQDEDSDNSLSEETLVNPMRHVKDKLWHYSMRDLGHSWLASLVSYWHAYLFWATACVFFANSANELLRWWIRWYTDARGYTSPTYSLFSFFSVQAKSWIWIAVQADLVRHCILLGFDALRPDAFEAFRRSVLGEAVEDVAQGRLYGGSWKPSKGRCSRKTLDLILQFLIYFCLDIIPLSILVSLMAKGSYISRSFVMVTFWVVPAASLQTLLFFTARVLSDAYIKVTALLAAWRSSVQECDDDDEESSDGDCLAYDGFVGDDSAGGQDANKESNGLHPEMSQENGVMEERNLCLIICRAFVLVETLLPHALWIGAVIVGVVTRQLPMIVSGLFWAAILSCYAGGWLSSTLDFAATPCKRAGSKRVRALQSWGEAYCNLSYKQLLTSRLAPSVQAVVIGNILAIGGWLPYMATCMVVLTYLAVRQALFYIEKPWGWLLGISESLAFHLLTSLAALFFQYEQRWPDFGLILLLSFARIFGLKRPLSDGLSIKYVSTFWFCLVEVVIVSILILTINSAGAQQQYTSFCNPKFDNCSTTEFAYQDPGQSVWPQCSIEFPRRQKSPLSLADFGLFSALAYESQEKIDYGLKQYFPNWHLDDRHFTTSPALTGAADANDGRSLDWTTFYQFTESNNGTSVFAVRGTQYLIDIIQDIDLWLPAVSIMIFEAVGPNFATSFITAVAELTTTGRRDTEKKAFGVLLERVRGQMRAYPSRVFYITGHSLGGGIAKLVAAQVAKKDPDLRLPAIVFAAPGLEATSYVVYGDTRIGQVAKTSITVQPENDIVSRIDKQVGGIIPISCSGSTLDCHSISNSLCSIFTKCGSLRRGTNVTLWADCNKLPH